MNKNEPLLALKKYEEMAAACNRCGFCTSYCPTYKATGNEAHSPRGRNQMFRALVEGKISDPAQAKESIDSCLLCGECTSVCFSEVPTAKLMMEARHYLNETNGIPLPLRFFLEKILPIPKRFIWVLKAAFWGKNLGFSFLLKKTGVFKKFFPALEAADALLVKAPWKLLLDYPAAKKILNIKSSVAYMPVCGSQYLRPEIGLATLALCEKIKVDLMIPAALCCGLPAASYGVQDQVRHMAQENIIRLEKQDVEAILLDDSSCASHLFDWPKVFEGDAEWFKRASQIVSKVRDVSTLLLERGLKFHLRLAPWGGGRVAYHDPCKTQYARKSTDAPRELLAAIPRLTVVPIADADQCCGGAGTYSFAHPEMSQKVLAAKVTNIMASGCRIVVTSSASCLVQLAAGLRNKNSNIQVMHITEFLIRALDNRR